MRQVEPIFRCRTVSRVDDHRIVSDIIFVMSNGLRWRDAPAAYGPPKTIYNHFIRWSRLGVFDKIFATLVAKGSKPDQLMIDATLLVPGLAGEITIVIDGCNLPNSSLPSSHPRKIQGCNI